MAAPKGTPHQQANVTMRVPVSMLDALKEIAPRRGFSGYQPLIKFYVSEGIRRDQEIFRLDLMSRLLDALRQRGVAEELLDEASQQIDLD